MKKIVLSILFTTLLLGLYAQNKTIKGRVVYEAPKGFEGVPAVVVITKDSVVLGSTDFDGFFRINIPFNQKELYFGTIGFDPAIIELTNACNMIEVVLMMTSTHDFISLKRAERRDKKRYKKLHEAHKQAFEQDIFETESPCYNRVFPSQDLQNRWNPIVGFAYKKWSEDR